jgi:NAD(P)-dependent dehydrogenase (short-subunit alcohol dehydrogenase family)
MAGIMQIRDSVCVVTGGSSGLGQATARALAERGARVANFDLKPPPSGAPAPFFVEVDITDESRVQQAIRTVVEKWGAVHVCVNCAGIARGAKVLSEDGVFPIGLFRRTIEVNLTGSFIVLSRAAEQMALNPPGADGERGVIVNTASIAGFDASSSAAYAASKGGIIAMSLTVARDLARYGIRINAIAPGFMDTPMFGGLPPEYMGELSAKTVFPQRLGSPEEFAALACHIVESRFMNAAVIRFDAGARI